MNEQVKNPGMGTSRPHGQGCIEPASYHPGQQEHRDNLLGKSMEVSAQGLPKS